MLASALGVGELVAEPLRPLSTGELLDRTFALYKQNFALFVGIALPAPTLFLSLQLARHQWFLRHPVSRYTNVLLRGDVLWTWGMLLLSWFVGLAFTYPATIRAVSEVHLGRRTTIRESYRALRGRTLRVIGIVICWAGWVLLGAAGGFVMIMMAAAVIELSHVSFGVVGNPIVVGVTAFLVILLGGLLTWSRYALAIQACVVEELGVRAGLKRSKTLLKASVSRIIVVYLMFFVIDMAISFTVGYGVKYAAVPLHAARELVTLNAVATFITGALTGPLVAIAMSLLYYDERVRKEGFDLQLMMASLEAPLNAEAAATA